MIFNVLVIHYQKTRLKVKMHISEKSRLRLQPSIVEGGDFDFNMDLPS